MFFVIWGHCIPSSVGGAIRKYIYSFHMPLFFFISGLTCHKSMTLDFKSFIKKKAKSLLLPYLIINIFVYIINFILSQLGIKTINSLFSYIIGTVYSNNHVFIAPSGTTWFILTLFLTEILFYIIHKISKDDTQLFFFTAICGIVGYLSYLCDYNLNTPWHFNVVFTAIVFYLVGYLITKHIEKIQILFKSKKKMFIYGLILGMIGVACAYFNRRVSMHGNLYGSITLFYISSFSSIFGLIFLIKLMLEKNYLLKEIGKYTLFYLGYQNIVIHLYNYFFPIFKTNDLYFFLLAIIVTLVMFPFAMLVYKKLPIFIGKDLDKLFKRKIKTT
jgi:fucose 4-O-acetylase-like acetyltransferase